MLRIDDFDSQAGSTCQAATFGRSKVEASVESFFYITVAVGALFAITDWRAGVMIAIILDCFRDPIRKVSEGEPTLVTYCVCAVWGAAFVNLFFGGNPGLRKVRARFPWLEKSLTWYVLGLIPGAVLSLALYQNGVVLAGLGFASYAAPLLGIALGAAFAFELKYLKRILQAYVLINSIAFIGAIAEWQMWDWPGLGGLKGFEWIRHMPGVIVRLISGFFRSPDIAGFHAANAMMVSVILLLNRGDQPGLRRKIHPLWLSTAIWSAVPLMLCGRRKMLIMPIIFIAAYLLYIQLAAKQSATRVIGYLVLIIAIGAVPLAVYRDEASFEDHQAYYATTLSDVAPRLKDNVAGGVVGTLRQSGLMGSGLGVATQGAQHFAVEARHGVWQEDGVSRLFKELGVPGVMLIAVSGLLMLRNCRTEVRRQRYLPLIEIQAFAFALIMANLASFVASHQHFSGDPANALWVLLFCGIFIGTLALSERPVSRSAAATVTRPPTADHPLPIGQEGPPKQAPTHQGYHHRHSHETQPAQFS
ncbi:hypothetical protein FYK55_11705 [Roseiconus nitratireducens]|uniref:O-antigen ligase n=1 Tax=Roseiconus nitratireducens TaxID=2605748 RepID=A0A5M6D8I2_9BACT|nr:hypothetical protein [Roseiconus nitratireducens]KAA5543827.1 hypothetical protein FYK55_11705 [Roseiconus nitratireducens]